MDWGRLVYVWRPVTGGRHAFEANAVESTEDMVAAYCGAEARVAELRGRSELDWIREETCMTCWRILADLS